MQDEVVTDRLVMAVDGNSLVHRSFHAQAATGTRTPDGRPIWAVRGLLGQLVAAVERLDPDVVVVGFDDPDDSWRKREWPGYKGTRGEKLDTLVSQLERAVEVLSALGLTVVVPPALEADDVLASTAECARTAGARTVVVSSDRDAFALIDDTTSVLRIIDGGVEASPLLTPDRLHLLLGIRAGQYGDFAALRGDNSDNLAGVQGIGPKTAAKLLGAFGSAAAAFDALEQDPATVVAAIGKGATARLAAPGAREAWERNRAVMRMRTDVAVPLTAGLPLAEDDVRGVYTEHQLTSTLPSALRCLARVDVPGPVVTRAWNSGASGGGHSWGRPARHAPLPRRRDEGQLTLF
ncbi:5'-3' exonuclease [Jatrophihabitans sp. YIM 134969]